MGRLLVIALLNVAAYYLLRVLWPELLRGRRTGVFAGLAVLSLAAWAVPLVLGVGSHGAIPSVAAPLRFFSAGWTVAVVMVLLGGGPVALVRSVRNRIVRARAAGQGGAQAPAEAAPATINLGRRDLLTGVGRAVPVLAVGTSSMGIAGGASNFTVRRLEVRLNGLPAALDGFKIGQITDIHVGPFIDGEYLRNAVRAMNEAQVDLQVMTGDLVDDLDQLDDAMAALAECRAPHGMLAVLGNHEHWRGLGPILEAYEELAKRGGPVRLLVDEAHVLEHAGERIRVVGVDYPMGRLPGMKEAAMKRSAEVGFRDATPDELVLCLAHHPDFFPYASDKGARLTLSGHTHGGQAAILGIPVFGFVFEYMLGRYKRGDNHLYVSGGTGHWMPFRIGVPTEVTVITLRAGKDARAKPSGPAQAGSSGT